MLALFFILLMGAVAYLYYYFNNKISNQRKQILLLKRQNNDLKHKGKHHDTKNLTIKYVENEYTEGLVLKDCVLNTCPMEFSSTINSLTKDTNVKILDSVEINDELWYQISIITEENLTTKGWIKAEFVSPYIDSD